MLSDDVKEQIATQKYYNNLENKAQNEYNIIGLAQKAVYYWILPKAEAQEKLMKEMGDVFGLILEELEDENYHDIVRLCKDMINKTEGLK